MRDLPHPPSCYDEQFHLRVSPLLWLVILWSMHPLLFLGVATFSNSGEIFRTAVDYGYNVPSFLSSIPGALVLVARMNRAPSAGEGIRGIWRNGHALLAVGLVMQLGTVLVLHWKDVTDFRESFLAALAMTAALLIALLSSRYSRDLFADFPEPEPEASGK